MTSTGELGTPPAEPDGRPQPVPGDGGPAPAEPGPSDRSKQQLFLLLALLIFYGAVPLGALVIAVFSIGVGGSIESEFLVRTLNALAKDPSAYFGILQQMIVPVLAAATVASFDRLRLEPIARWLFIGPLLIVFLCLIDGLLFNSLDLSNPSGTEVAQPGVVGPIFLNMAATMAVYVMTLVGLQLKGKDQ